MRTIDPQVWTALENALRPFGSDLATEEERADARRASALVAMARRAEELGVDVPGALQGAIDEQIAKECREDSGAA